MQLNMPSINWASTMQSFSIGALICMVVIGVLVWLFISIKNKKTYKYPITLRVRREGGLKVRFDLLGGIVTGNKGIKEFKIKIPGNNKKVTLGYMPDFSLADKSDRLSFIQEGDATLWQQVKEELLMDKYIEIETPDGNKQVAIYKLLIEPIPTDIKTTTYNNMQQTRELMDIKKLTAFSISLLAFVIMVVAHLISLWLQTKIKCGVA